MVASPQKSYLTPEEYLQLESSSEIKHEYFDGEIFAMAGATDTHVTIALNIAVLLRSHLRGSACRVYISDMKVQIESKNRCLDDGAVAPSSPKETGKALPSVSLAPDGGAGSHRFYYPDVMVTCEAEDREYSTYKKFPRLIIEVLSDSTEAFDRGDKFADYQSISTLEEYVLINTKKSRIECFRRTDNDLWLLQFYELDKVDFALSSVEFEGKIEEVYQDVDFPSKEKV